MVRALLALCLALHASTLCSAGDKGGKGGKGGGGVKEIKSKNQFETLMKYHKLSTGLPVVVDFYSDSCGPCRMMAPIFKNMAKEYAGRAVFVKVNVQSADVGQQIRSMPTFQFWLNGKKMEEFAGGDEASLRRITNDLSRKARQMNMEMTAESLLEFYKEHEPTKTVGAHHEHHTPTPHPPRSWRRRAQRTGSDWLRVLTPPFAAALCTDGRLQQAPLSWDPDGQAREIAEAEVRQGAEDDGQGPQEEEEEGREE